MAKQYSNSTTIDIPTSLSEVGKPSYIDLMSIPDVKQNLDIIKDPNTTSAQDLQAYNNLKGFADKLYIDADTIKGSLLGLDTNIRNPFIQAVEDPLKNFSVADKVKATLDDKVAHMATKEAKKTFLNSLLAADKAGIALEGKVDTASSKTPRELGYYIADNKAPVTTEMLKQGYAQPYIGPDTPYKDVSDKLELSKAIVGQQANRAFESGNEVETQKLTNLLRSGAIDQEDFEEMTSTGFNPLNPVDWGLAINTGYTNVAKMVNNSLAIINRGLSKLSPEGSWFNVENEKAAQEYMKAADWWDSYTKELEGFIKNDGFLNDEVRKDYGINKVDAAFYNKSFLPLVNEGIKGLASGLVEVGISTTTAPGMAAFVYMKASDMAVEKNGKKATVKDMLMNIPYAMAYTALNKVEADLITGKLYKAFSGRSKILKMPIGVVSSGLAEGVAEGIQTYTEKAKPGKVNLEKDEWKEVRDSTIYGALGGGTVAGTGAVLDKAFSKTVDIDNKIESYKKEINEYADKKAEGKSEGKPLESSPIQTEQSLEERRKAIQTQLDSVVTEIDKLESKEDLSEEDKANLEDMNTARNILMEGLKKIENKTAKEINTETFSKLPEEAKVTELDSIEDTETFENKFGTKDEILKIDDYSPEDKSKLGSRYDSLKLQEGVSEAFKQPDFKSAMYSLAKGISESTAENTKSVIESVETLKMDYIRAKQGLIKATPEEILNRFKETVSRLSKTARSKKTRQDLNDLAGLEANYAAFEYNQIANQEDVVDTPAKAIFNKYTKDPVTVNKDKKGVTTIDDTRKNKTVKIYNHPKYGIVSEISLDGKKTKVGLNDRGEVVPLESIVNNQNKPLITNEESMKEIEKAIVDSASGKISKNEVKSIIKSSIAKATTDDIAYIVNKPKELETTYVYTDAELSDRYNSLDNDLKKYSNTLFKAISSVFNTYDNTLDTLGVKELLNTLLDSKNEDYIKSIVPVSAMQALVNIGAEYNEDDNSYSTTSAHDVYRSIGKNILKELGIKFNEKKTTKLGYDSYIYNLGYLVAGALSDSGLINIKMDSGMLTASLSKKLNPSITAKIYDLSNTEENPTLPVLYGKNGYIDSDRADRTKINPYIDKLGKAFPLANNFKKGLKALQKKRYKIDTDFFNLINKNIDNIMSMIDEDQTMKLSNWNKMLALYEHTKQGKYEFSYSWKSSKVLRYFIKDSVGNFQQDGIFARWLIVPNKSSKFDISDTDKYDMFKAAVLQGFGLGKANLDIGLFDRNTNKILGDYTLADIFKTAYNLTHNSLTKDDGKVIREVFKSNSMHGFKALYELGKNLYKSETGYKINPSIDTNLLIEFDGATNGFAIQLAQIAGMLNISNGELESMFAKIGLFKNPNQSMLEFLNNAESDIYVITVNAFNEYIRNMNNQDINDMLTRLTGSPKLNRSLGKIPFSPFLYGSGTSNMISDMSKQLANSLKGEVTQKDMKVLTEISSIYVDTMISKNPIINSLREAFYTLKDNTNGWEYKVPNVTSNTTLDEYEKIEEDVFKSAPNVDITIANSSNEKGFKQTVPLFKTQSAPIKSRMDMSRYGVTKKTKSKNKPIPSGFQPIKGSQTTKMSGLVFAVDTSILSRFAESDPTAFYLHDAVFSTIDDAVEAKNRMNSNFKTFNQYTNMFGTLSPVLIPTISSILDSAGFNTTLDNIDQRKIDELNKYKSINQYNFYSRPGYKPGNEVKRFNLESNSDAILNIYDEIASMDNEVDFELREVAEHLNSYLGTPIHDAIPTVVLENTDSLTSGSFDINSADIKVAIGEIRTEEFNQSAQEVFVHELVHRASVYGLKHSKILAIRLNNLMKAAKKHIDDNYDGYKFFDRGNTKSAKQLYKYVFTNPAEFMAFAVANKEFRDAIRDAKVKRQVSGVGLLSGIKSLLLSLLGIITDRFKNNTMDKETSKLFKDIYEANLRAEQKVSKSIPEIALDEMEYYNKKIYNILQDFNKELDNLKHTRVYQDAKSAVEAVGRSIANSKYLQGQALARFGTDFWNEVIGMGDHENIQSMLKHKAFIMSTYTHQKHALERAIKNILYGSTSKERIALHQVLIKSNMSALTRYTPDEKIKLLSDQKYLESEIENLTKKLLDKADTNKQKRAVYYMTEQARGLGEYMTKGTVSNPEDQMLNSYNIASLKYADNVETIPNSLYDIQHLVSLWGIYYSDQDTKDIVSKYMNQNAQGVQTILNLHREYKKRSKNKLFSSYNQDHFVVENYYKMQTDNSIEVKHVRPGKELSEHLKAGYKVFGSYDEEQTRLVGSKSNVFIIVYKPNTNPGFTEGVVETAYSGSRGTDISEVTILTQVDDRKRIIKKAGLDDIKIESGAIYEKLYAYKDAKHRNQLVPLLDDKGDIISYRFVMSEASKAELLNIKEDISIVLSDTFAFTERKIDGYNMNNQLFNELMMEYRKLTPDQRKDWVEVSPDENELWYALIPPTTRKFINKYVLGKDEKLHVPYKAMTYIFGYQNTTVANNPIVKHSLKAAKYLQKFESMWQDVVSVDKKDILMRMPKVVIGNIMSNVVSLSMYMSTSRAIEFQLEAVEAMDEYRNSVNEIYELQLRKKAGEQIDETELESLQKTVRESIVTKLQKKGEYQILIEDFDMSDMDVSNTVEKIGMDILNKLPKSIREPLKVMYMTDDTKLFQLLSKMFQYSDFAAKYALYKQKYVIEGMNEQEVIDAMDNVFVDFSYNSPKALKYLDDMGVFMFNKYYFRIIKGIRKTLAKKFINIFTLKTAQWASNMDIVDILDTPTNLSHRINVFPSEDLVDILEPDIYREVLDAL